jgi:hypothetical protein
MRGTRRPAFLERSLVVGHALPVSRGGSAASGEGLTATRKWWPRSRALGLGLAALGLLAACASGEELRVDAPRVRSIPPTSTGASTTSTTVFDMHPEMKVVTPSVPRGGVMRVEGTTCGDRIAVGASNTSSHEPVPGFSGSYIPMGDGTPHPFAFGASVPVTTLAGVYDVQIGCWFGDAGELPSVRTVTVTAGQVDPVVTEVSGPARARAESSVHLAGSGCHSGGITATQARVLIGTSSGFGMTWDEHIAAVSAQGDFVVDAVLPTLVAPNHFPRWFVTTYCVAADTMNYGEASTSIELVPEPPTPSTTVRFDPQALPRTS